MHGHKYIHIYICTYIRLCVHLFSLSLSISVPLSLSLCFYLWLSLSLFFFIARCVSFPLHVYIYIYMYIYVYIHIYICIYVYIYIYIYVRETTRSLSRALRFSPDPVLILVESPRIPDFASKKHNSEPYVEFVCDLLRFDSGF